MIALVLAVAWQASTGQLAVPAGDATLPPRERLNAQEALQLVRAESLFYSKRLPDARRLAERLEDRHPNNPDVLLLLGRIHLAWPVIGRYKAESLFTKVGRLRPDSPEPFYLIAEVGVALRGEEGDNLLRRGLIGALGANPDYRDAWERWEEVPKRDADRLLMERALARHAGFRTADYRRAQMLVQMNRTIEAADLLDSVVARQPSDAGALAWLARARFANDEDSAGARAYESALRYAADDTGQVLWKQVRGIASVAERDSFLLTTPGGYSGYFRRFWARRDPDLTAPINRRYAEHFHRLAVVTHEFTLMHAGSRYFRSALYRARTGDVGNAPDPYLEGAGGFANAAEQSGVPRAPSVRDEQVRQGMAPRITAPAADLAVNLEDDIDDRGRIYLRHGKPDDRSIGPHAMSETWTYLHANGRPLRVSFLRRTGEEVGSGDMVLTAMTWGEAEAASLLLATDRTSVARNDMEFSFRTATFRAADGRRTELLVLSDTVERVGVLLDSEGRETDRRSGSDATLWLTGRPGSYALMLDAHRDALQSHYRGTTFLPDYGDGRPSVSSLLLAPGATTAERNAMVNAVPMRLELSANAPVRVYAEIYGLAQEGGASRYRAEYRFERTDGQISEGSRDQTIAFDRERPRASHFVETLIIDPDRLPPGRYVLRLRIIDQLRNEATASSQVQFRLR